MEFPVLHNLEIFNVSFQSSFDQINMSGNVFDQCNDTKIATPSICTKDTSLDMAKIMTTEMPHLLQKTGTIALMPFLQQNDFSPFQVVIQYAIIQYTCTCQEDGKTTNGEISSVACQNYES